MAFETLHSLYPALLVGELPAMPAHAWITVGEELRELLHTDDPPLTLDKTKQAAIDDAELERIKQILIDFGALADDDFVTGLADLIEVLLPPAEQ